MAIGVKMEVNQSIREINNNSWVIGGRLLLRRTSSPATSLPSWSDDHGSFYVLSEIPEEEPVTASYPLPVSSELRKVYDAGNVSAVWHAGDAFIKVKKGLLEDATREHVTLDYLWARERPGFSVPKVFYHGEWDGRYYIVVSRLPGQLLGEAWRSMEEATKKHYVTRVATICQNLAEWKNDTICGVDGRQIPETFLDKISSCNCNPEHLLKNSEELGMDCSEFVFYHCDLGAGNIIIGPDGSLGILDWESAGFVPKMWIRTKFRVSSGLDLPDGADEETYLWRQRVSLQLEEMGFSDVADKWIDWWHS